MEWTAVAVGACIESLDPGAPSKFRPTTWEGPNVTDTATSTETAESSGDGGTDALLSELRAWLAKNWDLDLTVGDWWERLGLAGWSAPGLPENAFGKRMARADAVLVAQEIANFGAVGAPAGLGLLLAAPTIATHGTQEQIDLYVRDIVTGKKAWCQLFSEPQAGSDLAGLQTRAVRDGDEWIINGQKVWTSGGQYADLGMLLARTDPEVPKHVGISYFAFEMHQEGVDVRPLKEMTGHALFNEVFLTDARVADSALIGGLNKGWAAANTTLMNERAGLGSGGGNAAGGGLAQPGTVLGFLGKRAGDIVSPNGALGAGRRGQGTGGGGGGAMSAMRIVPRSRGRCRGSGIGPRNRSAAAKFSVGGSIAAAGCCTVWRRPAGGCARCRAWTCWTARGLTRPSSWYCWPAPGQTGAW